MEVKRKSLIQLFVPIALETFFFMLTGMIDTLMLSSVSDAAVGAVGTANTYIGLFIITFNIISAGMIAVMTQYIGAHREEVAKQAMKLGVMFNASIGLLLSVILIFFAGAILRAVGVAPLLYDYSSTYLRIVGGCCFLNALLPVFSSYLRAFGHTRQPLYGTISANIVNLVLNAFFLFVMKWGVAGVAIATVVSRLVNLLINVIYSRRLIKNIEKHSDIKNRVLFAKIIRIGLPAAFELALYNVAMTLTIRFLNQMDANGVNVTARAYAVQIANFSYCVGAALAQANAIMTGWFVGAREFDECDRQTQKSAITGIIIAATLEALFALFGNQIMTLFSSDPEMISVVRMLLTIDIVLEMGRVGNLVFGQALKTSGDAIFPTIIGAIFMYICMVFGTYIFGIRMGMMVVGAYIAMASDECIRAILMFIRWKSGKWRGKSLV